jgi:PKD repeat protein
MPTGATAVTYEWKFGDGKTGRGESVTHTYTRAGTYQVTLTVTDSAGRSGTTTENITVREALPSSGTGSGTDTEEGPQLCSAFHISMSRSAVQMRGFLMPLASS